MIFRTTGYILDGGIFWYFEEDTAFPRYLTPAQRFSKDGKKTNRPGPPASNTVVFRHTLPTPSVQPKNHN